MAAITIRLNYNFGSSVQCCTLPLQAIRVVCETSLDRNVFREKLHVIPVDTGLEKPRRKKRGYVHVVIGINENWCGFCLMVHFDYQGFL